MKWLPSPFIHSQGNPGWMYYDLCDDNGDPIEFHDHRDPWLRRITIAYCLKMTDPHVYTIFFAPAQNEHVNADEYNYIFHHPDAWYMECLL